MLMSHAIGSGMAGWGTMTPFTLSGFCIAVTCCLLATFIFWRSPRTELNHLMAWFNVFVGLWGLGTMLAGMARTPETAIRSWRLAHIGGFPLGMVFYHIAGRLSGIHGRPSVKSVYWFAAMAVLLSVTGLAMSDTQWLFGSLHYFRANRLYGLLLAIWLSIVVLGHRRLSVSTSQDRGSLMVVIEDTGNGMAAAELKRLGDPFFTTKPHGTGLGLSIVKGLVAEHRGQIIFDSELGRGTRCTLAFPVVPAVSLKGVDQLTHDATAER